jgi:YD repeat-containing protein
MARVPIRLRLTIAFVGVIAVMLAATGTFLYVRFARDLEDTIDAGLSARVTDVLALSREETAVDQLLADSGERYAQTYVADGRVLASTRRMGRRRLLSVADVRRAREAPLVADRTLPDGKGRVRAASAHIRGGMRVVVAVGEPLGRSDDELAQLGGLLLIALPFALLLAGFAGYEVAGSALRPVERMRSRAEAITEDDVGGRLPLPDANDEIGRLGHTLNQLLARLEGALARERRLVSEASHELRTPLSVLRTEVDLALKGDRDPAELRAALDSVGEEVDRLTRLADDLLVLARVEGTEVPVRPRASDPGALLRAAADRQAPGADERGRALTVAVPDGLPRVQADPDRMAQALDNLVLNALAHGAGAIELSARPKGGSVELHVTDEGEGFPPGFIDRAFERFSRGPGRVGVDGTGLGLAITAAIAAAHGGGAGAANRDGGGADVWVALPTENR